MSSNNQLTSAHFKHTTEDKLSDKKYLLFLSRHRTKIFVKWDQITSLTILCSHLLQSVAVAVNIAIHP